MALSSTSYIRSLRSLSYTATRTYATLTPYSPPQSDNFSAPRRNPRPLSPQFFTGRPQYHDALASLSSTIQQTQSVLRDAHIYPLPTDLPYIAPPKARWVSPEELSSIFNTKLRTSTLRQVMNLLGELHNLRHVSELTGYHELAAKINVALQQYEKGDIQLDGEKVVKPKKAKAKADEFGRAYAIGRRKTSSAQVWMIPSPSARALLDATEAPAVSTLPTSEILINHVPLTTYFPRIIDRETVLRPLRLTGLLGAYNIFARSTGGGIAGQAGAIALGVARTLAILRDDTTDVLRADGALMRDPRMVERKKTGKAKADKSYTWVKR